MSLLCFKLSFFSRTLQACARRIVIFRRRQPGSCAGRGHVIFCTSVYRPTCVASSRRVAIGVFTFTPSSFFCVRLVHPCRTATVVHVQGCPIAAAVRMLSRFTRRVHRPSPCRYFNVISIFLSSAQRYGPRLRATPNVELGRSRENSY